jgi:hypothetical protein
VPVKPLARVDVTPEDFPFCHRLAYYKNGESIVRSLLRASF